MQTCLWEKNVMGKTKQNIIYSGLSITWKQLLLKVSVYTILGNDICDVSCCHRGQQPLPVWAQSPHRKC